VVFRNFVYANDLTPGSPHGHRTERGDKTKRRKNNLCSFVQKKTSRFMNDLQCCRMLQHDEGRTVSQKKRGIGRTQTASIVYEVAFSSLSTTRATPLLVPRALDRRTATMAGSMPMTKNGSADAAAPSAIVNLPISTAESTNVAGNPKSSPQS